MPPLRSPFFSVRSSIVGVSTILLIGIGISAVLGAPRVAKRPGVIAATPDVFAQSALNTILGDITQEISAGSNLINGGSTTIYVPKAPATGVTALAGSTGKGGLENLLKRSAFNTLFFTGASYNAGNFPPSNRAANVSTVTSSLNGLTVLPLRWNKPLLLSKANAASDTDLSPVNTGANAFVPPDWVLVARDGSNPTAWNPNLQVSDSGATSVVGRFAYTIYDEGGLLDMSVAGHPATSDARQTSYKDSLASADLTQVLLTQPQIDAVANWRGSHAFAGRQDLISLLVQSVATDSATRANLQNSLRFLGTTSRGLSQPSYVPISRVLNTNTNPYPRPLILPSSNTTDPTKGGGNNVGDNYPSGAAQDGLSPSFLTLRTEAAFIRNDGSTTAVVGEPLAKTRFALQRLAWLTYLGPSAARNVPTSNPGVDTPNYDLWQLVNNYGISRDYLALGTADNIKRYFGLEWDAANTRWKYDLHNRNGSAAGTTTGATGGIRQLQEIADLQTREPDFFEMLKASVDPGSLGKASTLSSTADVTEGSSGSGAGNAFAPMNFQFLRDISYDAAIIQLGANIIDQFDADGYPTRIVFDDGSGRPAREFRGVENLPYIYRVRTGVLRVREPVPEGQGNGAGAGRRSAGQGDTANDGCNPERHSGAVPAGNEAAYPVRPLKDTGVGLLLAVPDIWNPHDQNSSLGSPRPGLSAGSFRVLVSSATPDGVDAGTGYSTLTVGGGVVSSTATGRYKGASYQPLGSGSGGAEPPGTVPTGAPSGYDAPVPPFSRVPTPVGTSSNPMANGYNSPLTVTSVPTASVPIPTSSTLTFGIPNATLFREPTLLAKPDTTTGSGLSMTISNPDVTQLVGDSGNVWTGTGLKSSANPSNPGTNPLVQPSAPAIDQPYIGLYLGAFPLRWVGSRWSGGPYVNPSTTFWVYTDRYPATQGGPAASMIYTLQCQDASGNWMSYDQKYVNTDVYSEWVPGGLLIDNTTATFTFADPRTTRFAAPDEEYMAYDSSHYRSPTSATWLDNTTAVITTERPDIHAGFGLNMRGNYASSTDWGTWAAAGWHYKNIYGSGVNSMFFETGLLAQNDPAFASDGLRYQGDTGVGATDAQFYSDPDGVVRRAAGAYVTAGGAVGQPLATASTYANGKVTPTSQSQSRPIILNRPFRSVAELGCVFSGTPWKNVDFSTPESGYSELLDVFCAYESDASVTVAGRVNLNTRQPAVLQAILAGAYTDEETNFAGGGPAWGATPLSATDAGTIANLLVSRTSATPLAGPNASFGPLPLLNVGDLVGRWNASQPLTGTYTPALYASHRIDGKKSYDGFSADLGLLPGISPIPRLRESAVRALANVGNTRVWNLLLDVVAQTGEYTQAATNLAQFTVEGSQRYWLHVAIDRLTGAIVDQSLEAVPEVAPTDLTITNTTVPENQPAGASVGKFGAINTNSASVFTYTLVNGTGSDDNGSFAISGNTLQTNAVFRYLDKSSYHVRVREVDQDGMSFEKSLLVSVTPGAYTQWKITNFGNSANDPAVAGNLVDADGDGLSNLVEYALGTSPLVAGVSGIEARRVGNSLQFNYTRSSAASDVTAHAYWNSDLTNPNGWSTSGINETLLSDDGTVQHWEATLPLTSNQNAFMRLQVTAP